MKRRFQYRMFIGVGLSLLTLLGCAGIPKDTPPEVVQLLQTTPDEALQLGLTQNDPTLVKLAIQKGADVNKTNEAVHPLARASAAGQTDIIKLLLKQGAVVGSVHESVLSEAVKSGDKALVEKLLAEGADANSFYDSWRGLTMIMLAIQNDHPEEVVALLLAYDANPDGRMVYIDPAPGDKGSIGETNLMLAAQQGKTAVVRQLLQAGAKADLIDRYKKTALDYAEMVGAAEIAELIRAAQK